MPRSLFAALAVAFLSIGLTGCRSESPLPTYATLPAFQLLTQQNQPFTLASMKGRVWVVDFMFTSCKGPCPRMSSQMSRLQTIPNLKLLSISVDPHTDKPAILAAYAQRFRAEPGRWIFLTGPMETVRQLDQKAFKIGLGEQEHSTRFILVDRQSCIRGYYLDNDPESIAQLHRDALRLLKEKA